MPSSTTTLSILPSDASFMSVDHLSLALFNLVIFFSLFAMGL
jgi:hypothetical protein